MTAENNPTPRRTDEHGNPIISLEELQAHAYDMLQQAYDPTKASNGMFIVKDGNQWLQHASSLPIPTMLCSELWHEGELCILFADTNVGKSILAVQIADSISRGIPIEGLKLQAEAQPVVYFDFELYEKQFEARYTVNYQEHYRFHQNFYRAELHPQMELPKGCDTFEECLMLSLRDTVLNTDARILIIDNLTYLRTETERAKDAMPLMKELMALKKNYGLSILALAHTPKRDPSKPITRNDLQGSKMLINFCDSSFCIGESSQTEGLRYIKQIKARNTEIIYGADNVLLCAIEKPYNFLQFSLTGYSEEREHLKQSTAEISEEHRQRLIAQCKELSGQGMSQRDIADELGIGKSTVDRLLKL